MSGCLPCANVRKVKFFSDLYRLDSRTSFNFGYRASEHAYFCSGPLRHLNYPYGLSLIVQKCHLHDPLDGQRFLPFLPHDMFVRPLRFPFPLFPLFPRPSSSVQVTSRSCPHPLHPLLPFLPPTFPNLTAEGKYFVRIKFLLASITHGG